MALVVCGDVGVGLSGCFCWLFGCAGGGAIVVGGACDGDEIRGEFGGVLGWRGGLVFWWVRSERCGFVFEAVSGGGFLCCLKWYGCWWIEVGICGVVMFGGDEVDSSDDRMRHWRGFVEIWGIGVSRVVDLFVVVVDWGCGGGAYVGVTVEMVLMIFVLCFASVVVGWYEVGGRASVSVTTAILHALRAAPISRQNAPFAAPQLVSTTTTVVEVLRNLSNQSLGYPANMPSMAAKTQCLTVTRLGMNKRAPTPLAIALTRHALLLVRMAIWHAACAAPRLRQSVLSAIHLVINIPVAEVLRWPLNQSEDDDELIPIQDVEPDLLISEEEEDEDKLELMGKNQQQHMACSLPTTNIEVVLFYSNVLDCMICSNLLSPPVFQVSLLS
ncbi:hypothetical protein Tco_0836195, partial [Tanacetum coccineum]